MAGSYPRDHESVAVGGQEFIFITGSRGCSGADLGPLLVEPLRWALVGPCKEFSVLESQQRILNGTVTWSVFYFQETRGPFQ